MRQNSNFFIEQCVCGQKTTSKPGATLHRQQCAVAIEAAKSGQPTTRPLVTEPREQHDGVVGEFDMLANTACSDAASALRDGNKSAARRARKALLELRANALLLRKALLAVLRK